MILFIDYIDIFIYYVIIIISLIHNVIYIYELLCNYISHDKTTINDESIGGYVLINLTLY